MEILFLIIGLVVGGLSVWLFMKGSRQGDIAVTEELRTQLNAKESELSAARSERDTEREARVEARTRLEEAQRSFEEQKALIEAMKIEMKDTFNALSSAALKSSSEDFIKLASENLGKITAETKGKLGEHKAQIEGLVKPLHESLKKYEEYMHTIEVKRRQEYTSLDEQIKNLASTHMKLQKETGNLVTALRKPHIRGRWLEITLHNVVELAGMSGHCDFQEQETVSTETGRMRPDMTIRMPGGHKIVVDSKASMEALLDGLNAETEEARKEALKRHAQHLRKHVDMLSSKSYWAQFDESPELTVAFVSESSLAAALEADGGILEESMAKRVLIATPTTLFGLLTAIAYGWRQEKLTKNAEEISTLGKELYERVSTFAKHLSSLGKAISQSVEAYNKTVGSVEARVLPSVRKFKELGAASGEDIPIAEPREETPRNLSLLDSD